MTFYEAVKGVRSACKKYSGHCDICKSDKLCDKLYDFTRLFDGIGYEWEKINLKDLKRSIYALKKTGVTV